MIPIFYAIKLRNRGVKSFLQVHTTSKWKAKLSTQRMAYRVHNLPTTFYYPSLAKILLSMIGKGQNTYSIIVSSE